MKCRHFNREAWTDDDRRTCPAFPEGIPDEIWRGDNNHQAPFEGDNGIQFEARDADQSEDDVDE
ncbi:MAG: hypothetical protein HON70_06330 [Lentisphaerae bacterium]|nr:hypothetical protein [Lentisphaerota bacterium]